MQAIAIWSADEEYAEIYKSVSGVHYFTLDGVLSVGEILVTNSSLQTVQLLLHGEKHPYLLLQQQFTASEASLLFPLLVNYPHHCPYEVLFASFYNGSVTGETIRQARHQLQDAMEDDAWDSQMRPIRNVLSRIRFKLRSFNLDIISILETGYIIMGRKEKKEKR